MSKPESILDLSVDLRSMILEHVFDIANLRDETVPVFERYSRLCTLLRDPKKMGLWRHF